MLRPVAKERQDAAPGSVSGGASLHPLFGGSREPPPDPRTAETVGQLLAMTRSKFGQDLRQVAQALRIRLGYLEAIEGDRYSELPGLAYAVGFVRSYADYLGLDGKSLVQRYKDESQGLNRKPVLAFPAPMQEAKVPTGAIILVALVLLVLAYGGWTYFSRDGEPPPPMVAAPPAPQTPTAAAPTTTSGQNAAGQNAAGQNAAGQNAAGQNAAGQAAASQSTSDPLDSAQPGASQTDAGQADAGQADAGQPAAASPLPSPLPLLTPPALSEVPLAGTGGGAAAAPGGSLGGPLTAPLEGAAPPATPEPVVAAEPQPTGQPGEALAATPPPMIPPAPALPAEVQEAAVPAEPQPRIVLRAIQDSWVQIRDAKDEAILTQVLREGESYAVPDQAGLVLLTGNAGGLVIELDGKPLPLLGAVGQVKRNVALDPALLAPAN